MSPLLIIRLSLAEKIGLPYGRGKSFRSQKARWVNFLRGELVYTSRAGGFRLPHRVLLNMPHSIMVGTVLLIGDLREALPPE